MKKFLTMSLLLLLLLQLSVIAFAENMITVSADAVHLGQEEPILIPVKIENNSGLMGFKITVEYPADKVDVKSLSRGEFTSVGNFNSNFGINDGRFDVLWNYTEEIKSDGILFLIAVQLKTAITEDTEIKLSFSQRDTFNEKYEEVPINCKNIVIRADPIEQTTTENPSGVSNAAKPIDNSQILDAVKITLEQNGYDNLSDVKDTDKFVADFNKNLEMITGTNTHNVTSFETLKSMYNSAYEGVFIKELTENADTNDIQSAIVGALEDLRVRSISEIQNKNEAEFIEAVEKNLKQYAPETPNISKDLDSDAALSIIDKLYQASDFESEVLPESKNDSLKRTLGFVGVAAVLLAVIVSIVILHKKKKSFHKTV